MDVLIANNHLADSVAMPDHKDLTQTTPNCAPRPHPNLLTTTRRPAIRAIDKLSKKINTYNGRHPHGLARVLTHNIHLTNINNYFDVVWYERNKHTLNGIQKTLPLLCGVSNVVNITVACANIVAIASDSKVI